MSRDYYAVLEVDRWSDAPTVEHAYHTQARRFRGLGQRGPGRDVDSRALRHIEQAFHVLGEPQLRGSYDRALLDMLETAPPRNDDIIQMLEVSFDQAALGGKVAVERIAPSGPDQVDVHLPRGVDEGTLLRIGGLGMRDEPGDHAGDLILLVHIRPHPRLRRDGLDLYLDVTVPTDVARHGGRVRAGTLEGEVELNIPAGVRGGEKLLLRRAGLLDEANRRGDLYAVVQLQMSTLDQPAAKAPEAPAQRDSTADHAELAESLDRRMRQLTRDETEIEHRRTVTRNWEKQLAGRQAQIDQRAAAIAHRRRRLSALRAAMKQRRRQIAEASAAAPPDVQIDMRPLQQMQEKLEARERELAHQQQRLWEHRERFDRDKADFERERRDHARAVRVLEDQRDQLTCEAESLDQQRAELQRDADQLDQQRADHEHMLTEFAERQQQFETDSARLAADRTVLDERINDIAEQQAKIDQRVRHLDERDATFQRHEADLNRQRAELASAGEQVESDRQAKLAAVQAEIEEDRRAMKSQRDQLVALQQQLDQQAAELDDQRQRIAVVTTNLERRRRRLNRQRTLLREKSVAARQPAAPTEPPVISTVESLRLVMLAPGGQRRTITPTGSSVFIGRDGACDLCIPVSTVSRRHCRIEACDGAVILRDVGSKNGTYHNGQPVSEATLREGDSIAIGPVHFTVAAAE